jgi:hypothetical protein
MDNDDAILSLNCTCGSPRCKRKLLIYADGSISIQTGGTKRSILVPLEIARKLADFFEVPDGILLCPACHEPLYQMGAKSWECSSVTCKGWR